MEWRFIDSGVNTGAMNMAIDEAVMVHCADGKVPPTLRFYRWDPPTLTLGYFQKAAKTVDLERCTELGIDVVRRLTGGRAVLHDKELTYSLIMGKNSREVPESVTQSYKILSKGLLLGLRYLGIPATMSKPARSNGQMSTSGACFDALSSYELEVGGKKIVGSAQARRFGAILQHGSVMNDLSVDTLFAVLREDDPKRKESAKERFLEKATSIRHVTGSAVSWEDLSSAFFRGFSEALGVTFFISSLTESELSMAMTLATEKYGSPGWNLSR